MRKYGQTDTIPKLCIHLTVINKQTNTSCKNLIPVWVLDQLWAVRCHCALLETSWLYRTHNDPSVPTLSHKHPIPRHTVLDTLLSYDNPIHVPKHCNSRSVREPTQYKPHQLCLSVSFSVSIPSTLTYRKWTVLLVLYSLTKLCLIRLPSALGSFQTFSLCLQTFKDVDLSYLKTQSVPRCKHSASVIKNR
jgi:hypothetical protein